MPPVRNKKCCVKGCIKLPADISFCFPLKAVRSRIWLERCGNESLYHLNAKQLASRHVCAKHFARHAFTNELKNRLNFDAVPSMFVYNSPVISRSDKDFQVAENAEENQHKEYSPFSLSASVEENPQQETESTEGIMQEECYCLPVPMPETTEDIPNKDYYSQPLSLSYSHFDIKSSNCLQKEIIKLREEPQIAKNIKQYINKNNQKQNIRWPNTTDGKNVLAAADRCPVKSEDSFELCGLTGCNDSLYSDEKNVRHLVKCSSKCGKFFHLACTGLVTEEYDILCNNDALRWFCMECRM